jgi:hypothetical protein
MESGERNSKSERGDLPCGGATVGISSLVCSAYFNRRGFDLLGIFSPDDLFSFDPIIRLGSKSQEGQKIATYLSGIKKLLCYFSGSFAVGRVVMFYLR